MKPYEIVRHWDREQPVFFIHPDTGHCQSGCIMGWKTLSETRRRQLTTVSEDEIQVILKLDTNLRLILPGNCVFATEAECLAQTNDKPEKKPVLWHPIIRGYWIGRRGGTFGLLSAKGKCIYVVQFSTKDPWKKPHKETNYLGTPGSVLMGWLFFYIGRLSCRNQEQTSLTEGAIS